MFYRKTGRHTETAANLPQPRWEEEGEAVAEGQASCLYFTLVYMYWNNAPWWTDEAQTVRFTRVLVHVLPSNQRTFDQVRLELLELMQTDDISTKYFNIQPKINGYSFCSDRMQHFLMKALLDLLTVSSRQKFTQVISEVHLYFE